MDNIIDDRKQRALKLAQSGQLAEASTLLEEVCSANPQDAEAWYLLGTIYERLRSPDKAIRCYQHTANLAPGHALIPFAIGNAQQALGRLNEAVENYRQALIIDPDFFEAQCNLGSTFTMLGHLDEAAELYKQAIAVVPERAELYYNLACIQQKLGHHQEAILNCREAIRRKPDFAAAWDNLGVALTAAALVFISSKQRVSFLEDAITTLRRALQLVPGSADTHNNLAVALRHLGRYDGAIRSYHDALTHDPTHASAHEGLATVALLCGHFSEGWENYKYRVSMRIPSAVKPPAVALLAHKTQSLCIVRDQGLGDELFFLRFAARLKTRCLKLAYQPDLRLSAMLARANVADRILTADESANADTTCSVGDLPWLTGMCDLSDIPPPLVLSPLPVHIDAIRTRLASLGSPSYIGVTWRAGDKTKQKVLYKESPLMGIAQTLKTTTATVLILQRNPQPGEIDTFSRALGRPVHDLSSLNEDLEQMLALLSLIDEYVGVSNTNMHLRAAVGKTARVLVPAPPEWRWMAEGNESPWFPGFKIYRQGYDGSWEKAFDMLAADLKTTHGI